MNKIASDFNALIKNQPQKAIELLFSEYYVKLCVHVNTILKNKNVAEDIVQEVMLEIWKMKDQLIVASSVEAYLKRACRNKSLNYIRSQKLNFEDIDTAEEIKSDYINVEDALAVENLQEKIDEGINSLPEKCRLVFTLSRVEGLSYQEIADQLGISTKTVENQISKALRVLREHVYKKEFSVLNRGNEQ
ncbi:MAG: RNA polymerase sigma-70 factor [Saprospiraceae bacterium]